MFCKLSTMASSKTPQGILGLGLFDGNVSSYHSLLTAVAHFQTDYHETLFIKFNY